ncbi:response regulator [Candidatus Nitronereus thalassa]|uniref:Response regulator n=1 Tax=Candidatus Nitronereus thalassa TaxID=3020898 RepID=A0ABU3K7W6_9BACT|nr:response regulator [Candidatus Nitronereus thalassa]MDT7042491.1 response regulator [Candidatus Nitronereus thalassa]
MTPITAQQTILLVDDSNEDFEVTKRAFLRARMANPIHRCVDGEDALDYLLRRGEYADPSSSPRPGIIMLDLNMPGTDGREVLKVIKTDMLLKKIPVIVLTTSSADRDIEECYNDGANSYIVKPVDIDGFMDAIRRLRDYWFEVVVVPEVSS